METRERERERKDLQERKEERKEEGLKEGRAERGWEGKRKVAKNSAAIKRDENLTTDDKNPKLDRILPPPVWSV